MKPTDIEEAIEQNRTPVLNTYTFRGHSDDTIEVDGPNCGNGHEVYPNQRVSSFLFQSESSGRAFALVTTLVNDQWAIAVTSVSDYHPIPLGTYTISVEQYSTVITLETPELLIMPTEAL